MASYYEVNVSKDKSHFFATAPRSLTNKTMAYEVFNVLVAKFPKHEGYKVTLAYWQEHGEQLASSEVN